VLRRQSATQPDYSFNGKPQATVFDIAVACGLPLNDVEKM
jgi:hypothetical protein